MLGGLLAKRGGEAGGGAARGVAAPVPVKEGRGG